MRLKNKMILSSCLMCLAAPLALANPQATPDTGGTPERTAAPTPSPEIGRPVDYGRPGVLELGGSAGLTVASGIRDMNISPSLGWFVADNIELSAIASVSNVKAGGETATIWSALLEPSYHLPFNRTMFGFLGMGLGAAYVHNHGTGVAIAPRLGAKLLVGRSGILTPALSYEYITHDPMYTPSDETLVSVTSALRVNVGYTIMW